jgi:hypothetical protein
LWKKYKKDVDFPQLAVESNLKLYDMHKKQAKSKPLSDESEKICVFWKKCLTPSGGIRYNKTGQTMIFLYCRDCKSERRQLL